MAHNDAERWNKRYQQAGPDAYPDPRSFLVEYSHLLPRRGLALDLAMGAGQNAAYLVERGLEVVGLDISLTALMQARKRCPGIMAAVVDLEHYSVPGTRFDVLLNLYYLQREWFAEFERILKPGGLLVLETLLHSMQEQRPDLDPRHLLQPGELRGAFAAWDILVYREGWVTSDHGHQKAVASLIARRPEVRPE
jgi:SAM-dependent methyltransferase